MKSCVNLRITVQVKCATFRAIRGAFEVKLSSMGITDRAVERLHKFRTLMTGNPMAQTSEPSFLGFIVGHGEFAYQRDDGLLVLPYACIEP